MESQINVENIFANFQPMITEFTGRKFSLLVNVFCPAVDINRVLSMEALFGALFGALMKKKSSVSYVGWKHIYMELFLWM